MNPIAQGASAPVVFHFSDTYQIRVITIDGNPWFVASDVAKALDYLKASDMSRFLDDDEKGTHNLRTLGGTQELQVINESGLYSAILKSRKPEAKKFKKWVTSEVLPSIRRTGQYTAPKPTGPSEESISPADRNNLMWLVSILVGDLWGKSAWECAIWRALREVTGTESPEPFKVHQIPDMVLELRRIAAITGGLREAQIDTCKQVIKRCVRNREDTKTVLREMQTILDQATHESEEVLLARLTKWQTLPLDNFGQRSLAN